MKGKRVLRVICAVMAIVIFTAVSALADKAYVINDTEARVKASHSSRSYGTLHAGMVIDVVAVKDGWAKVKKEGKTAFVDSDDVAKIKNLDGRKKYLNKDAKLLSAPNGSAVKELTKGTAVKVSATAGEWACVHVNGKKGFLKTSCLTSEKPKPETRRAYINTAETKLYKKNSTSSKVIKTLDINFEVGVIEVKKGWAKVEAGAKTGFVKKKFLSEEKVDAPVKDPYTGYVANDKAKVYKNTSESSGVIAELELNTKVSVLAYNTTWCQVERSGKTAYMYKKDISRTKTHVPGDSTVTPAKGRAKEMDWWTSDISRIFAVGTVATITDVGTGIAWREKRGGGTNHADCQPLTADDTAAMKKVYGGSWSWDRRPIFVTINGVNYAASMNGMPHGSGSITDNNFSGHHCIHFTNSRTHGTNKVCPLHQSAIKKAAAAEL